MILTTDQIKEIILKNPNKDLINAGRIYNKELRKHFYGDGLRDSLPCIDGFEKPTLQALRVKYARSNKDLFARVSRPVDKVFSARGGSIYYNLSEAQDKKARQLASDVRSGYSIKGWIENFWKAHYMDDPCGVIFMEIGNAQQVARLKQQGKSYVYPTYKSIQSIYDYQPNGSSLEYIVFNVDNREKLSIGLKPEDKVFRVVDDANDYYIKQNGEEIAELSEYTLPNLFMYVPAILNSDIPNQNREGAMLSIFDGILSLADEFLLKGSIKVTHDFMHGFPKYWEYADDCIECKGTGYLNAEKCTKCKGTGKSIMLKVSDAKLLTHPQSKEDPVIAPNVAGYVSPDKTYYEISTHDLQLLEDLMMYTLWGANLSQKTQGMSASAGGDTKTATEIMSDIKPQSDRLNPISESAEKRHKFILDAVIQIQITQSYQGSSVNYGKRYMIESPDEIWNKYSDARARGAAYSILDDLLLEYYEAKYNSDPVKLAIQTKLMKVEPFVHLTATQLKPLGAAEEDYKAKLYFGEWLSTLNEAMVLSFSVEELRTQLIESVATKQLPQPEPKPGIAA